MIANTGTLTLNGTELPYVVHTFRQTEMLGQTLGAELSEVQAKLQDLSTLPVQEAVALFATFAWSALYAAAMKTDKRCDFTHADVQEWVKDEEMETAILEITKPLQTYNAILAEKKS